MPDFGSIDDVHLFHHLSMREIGISLGDAGIMQRDEREPISKAVEPTQMGDPGAAKLALSVVNHDISVVLRVRIGQVGSAKHLILAEKGDFALKQWGFCPLYLSYDMFAGRPLRFAV